MAAELNGYPGPKHVLELAGELELTDAQRGAVQDSYDAMHRAAVALGRELVEAEARLDALFAEGEATPEDLDAALEEIGALRADLRKAHLQAHLETRDLLTDEQVRRYQELRGYADDGAHDHHPGHRGPAGHGEHTGQNAPDGRSDHTGDDAPKGPGPM
ncbi:MAG: Spy/CpxP family protein refolding chaperone [Thermoanaerobaculia bacterium]